MLFEFGEYDDIEFEAFGRVNRHDADGRIGGHLGFVFLHFLNKLVECRLRTTRFVRDCEFDELVESFALPCAFAQGNEDIA